MPTRDERRAEASRHLALMKGAFAKETQATIDAAVVYEDGDAISPPPRFAVHKAKPPLSTPFLTRAPAVPTRTAPSAPSKSCARKATSTLFCAV